MKKYFILSVIILLTACELVVDVDVPFEGQQMTINSLFNPDSLWRTSLSLNRFILDDNPFDRVTNAMVIISDETGPIDTLIHEGNGIYRSDNSKPQPNKLYSITASSATYGTVQAQSVIPTPALVSNVNIESSDFNGEASTRITMQINDDPTTENYYAISIEVGNEYLSQNYEVLTYRYPAVLGRNDEGFQDDELTTDNHLLIKDVFYSGPEMNVTVHSPDWNLMYSANIIIHVKTLSKDYYDFISTSSLQNRTSGNPFAQPVQVYSNVQNGFGIFAGYSSQSVDKSQPEPTITSITPQAARPSEQIVVNVDNIQKSFNNITALIFQGNAQGVDQPIYSYPLAGPSETMTFYVPQGARTGRMWLNANGRITEWEAGFTVLD